MSEKLEHREQVSLYMRNLQNFQNEQGFQNIWVLMLKIYIIIIINVGQMKVRIASGRQTASAEGRDRLW